MRTITHAIDTRPFFLPSVLLEKKRPGNKAIELRTLVHTLLVQYILQTSPSPAARPMCKINAHLCHVHNLSTSLSVAVRSFWLNSATLPL